MHDEVFELQDCNTVEKHLTFSFHLNMRKCCSLKGQANFPCILLRWIKSQKKKKKPVQVKTCTSKLVIWGLMARVTAGTVLGVSVFSLAPFFPFFFISCFLMSPFVLALGVFVGCCSTTGLGFSFTAEGQRATKVKR